MGRGIQFPEKIKKNIHTDIYISCLSSIEGKIGVATVVAGTQIVNFFYAVLVKKDKEYIFST